MEPIKTLTLRNLESSSDMINTLKGRFNCSAAQALIKAGAKYIQVDAEAEQLRKELNELRQKHSKLKYKVGNYLDALNELKSE